jgi:hypothetical protein
LKQEYNEKVVSYPHTIYSLTLCAEIDGCWFFTLAGSLLFPIPPHLPNPKYFYLLYHVQQLLLLLLPLLIKTHDASFLPPSSNP